MKFAFGTNQLPWFRDKTNGIWRRAVLVPFTFALKSAEEADPHLRPKLRAELPGVLNWALCGLARLLKQGRFTSCEVCAAAREHREACSPVRELIANNFTVAATHDSPTAGKWWVVSSNEAMLLAKEHAAKYGDKGLSGHIVCREPAKLPGGFCRRPRTAQGRKDFGKLYCGVCVGEPKPLVPGGLDERAGKTGLDDLESAPTTHSTGATVQAKAQPLNGAKQAKGKK